MTPEIPIIVSHGKYIDFKRALKVQGVELDIYIPILFNNKTSLFWVFPVFIGTYRFKKFTFY